MIMNKLNKTVKPEKRRAYIIISIFVCLFAVYYTSPYILPLNFDTTLQYLPGYYHDSDTGRTTCELIESRGFICQTHHVTTDDGYILTVFRIVNPHIKSSGPKSSVQLKPILLQHGYQQSSSTFLINNYGQLNSDGIYKENGTSSSIGNTLAFVLAVSGYDVWLGNHRGNCYSINHTHMDPLNDDFWDFSIDEMIQYDLPAVISYILKQTSKNSLAYIGHSQGTIQMFGLLSSRPEYSSIVKPFIAMAPAPFMGHTTSLLRHGKRIEYLLTHGHITQSRIGPYVANLPVGTSSKNTMHIFHMIQHNKPVKFDYRDKNLEKYGQNSPPEYPLKEINSTNIALIYTANDWLVMLEDVDILKKNLKVPLLDDYLIPDKKWNHLELLWAKETGKYVNPRILKILKKF